MSDLIAALTIFLKYGNPRNPTNCGHDVMWVCIDPALVSPEDVAALSELGFFIPAEDGEGFMSHRYGSC